MSEQDWNIRAKPETYRPLHNQVLIKKKPRKQESPGGIIIPDELTNAQRNEHTVGIVLAIGPGTLINNKEHPLHGQRVPLDFKVGDEVVFNPYTAKVADKKLDLSVVLVPGDEILAVVEEGELVSL